MSCQMHNWSPQINVKATNFRKKMYDFQRWKTTALNRFIHSILICREFRLYFQALAFCGFLSFSRNPVSAIKSEMETLHNRTKNSLFPPIVKASKRLRMPALIVLKFAADSTHICIIHTFTSMFLSTHILYYIKYLSTDYWIISTFAFRRSDTNPSLTHGRIVCVCALTASITRSISWLSYIQIRHSHNQYYLFTYYM